MGLSYAYIIVLVASFGSLTFGFSNSVIGSVLGLDSFNTYFDLTTTGAGAKKTNAITGAASGLFFGGSAIGALVHIWLANYAGRVRAAQVTALLCIIAGAIQAGSVHIAMFLAGRFLAGIGVGLCVTLVPVYQSEIAPSATRGKLVGSHGTLIVSGYALAAWTGYGCFFASNGTFQWRFTLAAQCLPPLCLLLCTSFMPESPRWLIDQGKFEQALAITRRLHTESSQPNTEDDVLAEFAQMRTQIEQDDKFSQTAGKLSIFRVPSMRKRLLFGCLVMFWSQSTGVLVVNNYQVMLYNGLGLYKSVPLLLYAVYLSFAAFMNFVSAMIMDRVGRVRLMSFGLFVCAFCLGMEALMVAKFAGTDNTVGNGFGVFFLFLFVGFYATTLDATVYVYAAEIFPTHLRAQGMGLSIVAQSLTSLLHTQIAPSAFSAIGWKYYLVFVFVPLSGVFVIWRWFPETKGLSLEEIAALFGDKVVVGVSEGYAEDQVIDAKVERDDIKGDGIA
ncbi:related to sugar transporter [Fusarium oxysporum]|uniref:Related to sugar transporter n=1 Tax=Fusarium oxysporum TaxID=5507 RepID=A0A2H3TUN0_FUSOX|nr:related to sugar transporter [Fusarium oxysporum]